VLKLNQSLSGDDSIECYRLGGDVIYPAFHDRVTLRGYGQPIADRRYVFFLRPKERISGYDIVTAFDVTDGNVIAVDGYGYNGKMSTTFDRYTGWPVEKFLAYVRSRISSTE
jgi:hypothetical protein